MSVLKHFTRCTSPLMRPQNIKRCSSAGVYPRETSELGFGGHRRVGALPSPRALTAALAHSVCHAPHADLSLTNKLETGMMDSDSAVTCSLPSPLIAHQLAYLSINLSHDIHVPQIMYRLSSQLIQPPPSLFSTRSCLFAIIIAPTPTPPNPQNRLPLY